MSRTSVRGRAWVASVAAVVAALAPAPVAAQDARLTQRLDAPTRAVVTLIVDSARAIGIPTDPLVDKALEGASKRAGAERIAAAVRLLAADLAHARALLGTDASAGEIVSGARALRAGVSAAALQRFGRQRARRSMTVALAVLGELVARGVPPHTAVRSVLALTANGAGDEELVAYQQGVERGVQIGAPPAPLGLPGAGSPQGVGNVGTAGEGLAGAPPPPPGSSTPRPRRPPRP